LGFKINLDVIKREHQTQKNSSIVITHEEMRLYRYLKKLEKQSFK